MTIPHAVRRLTVASTLLAMLFTTGCGLQQKAVTPNFYTFDAAAVRPAATPAAASAGTTSTQPTLIVNPVHAAAGFDGKHIIYQREPHKQEYFAYSEWVDTPARMLTPLLVSALQGSGSFRAVVLTPSAAAGDMRLNLELVQLRQDFTQQPSKVRLALHAYLMDDTSRRVLAWRDVQVEVPASSDDPRGGVTAANQAVREALAQLATFCSDTARGWQPSAATASKR